MFLQMSRQIVEKRFEAFVNISEAQIEKKQQYGVKHKGSFFIVGDLLMKRNFLRTARRKAKQEDKSLVPYKIVDSITKRAYFIEEDAKKDGNQ